MIGCHRKTYRYKSRAKDQTRAAHAAAGTGGCAGALWLSATAYLLRREGWRVNHKRVYRLYRLEGLSVRSKVRKKRVSALAATLASGASPQ